MTNTVRNLLFLGPIVFGFAMSLTTPIVNLYFMRLVDAQVYAFVGVMYTAIAAVMQSVMSNERLRAKIRRWFSLIIVFDVFAFTAVSYGSTESVTLRFIGISALAATSVSLWSTIMMDAVNAVINGAKLTTFQSTSHAYCLWANLAGGLLSIALIDAISIELAMGVQCLANGICATTDYTAFKKLA